MDKKPKKSATTCGESPKSQKESLDSAPQTVAKHKNPDMSPVGSKAMTGIKKN